MGRKKGENRVGSVAYNRAHGLNKGAGGPGKSPSPSPSPSPTPSPSPSPTPTPTPSPSPSGGGGGAVNRVGSVAYNRAHGLNKGAGGAGKSGGSPAQQAVSRTNSFTNAQLAGNAGRAKGLVGARRDAAAQAGMSLRDYKTGLASGTINKHGKPTGQSQTYQPGHNAENTTAYGKTSTDIDTFKDYRNSHLAALNPNIDMYESGKERMSSEGLYQDRYNVGYHGDNDKGDEFASTSFMGSLNSAFDDYRKGGSFMHSYNKYVGTGRDEGYAGDVLKLIDQGRLKVNDDQYNMIVTDAENYDWDRRGEIAGRDSGDYYYDSRTGGRAGNQTDEAQQEYMKSIGHPAASGFQNDYDQGTSNQYQQNQYQQQNNMNYDFSQFMPTMKGSSKFNTFQFDPFKFLQGQ